MIPLATLDQVRAEIKETQQTGGVSGTDDTYAKRELYRVSEWIEDTLVQRWFTPRRLERRLDALGDHIFLDTLKLDEDLLSLVSLTNGDGSALALADVLFEPANQTPKYLLALQNGARFVCGSNWRQAIRIMADWGYHRDYANAWYSSLDTVQDNPLPAAATTITVSDVDGPNAYAESPRFSPGHLLRIESEYVEVLDIDVDINTLTVRRAANGTTAAEHAGGVAIDIWRVDEGVNREVVRLVGFRYKRRGTYEKAVYDGLAVTSFPTEAQESLDKLMQYQRWDVGAI